jgi:hypothetical protein
MRDHKKRGRRFSASIGSMICRPRISECYALDLPEATQRDHYESKSFVAAAGRIDEQLPSARTTSAKGRR